MELDDLILTKANAVSFGQRVTCCQGVLEGYYKDHQCCSMRTELYVLWVVVQKKDASNGVLVISVTGQGRRETEPFWGWCFRGQHPWVVFAFETKRRKAVGRADARGPDSLFCLKGLLGNASERLHPSHFHPLHLQQLKVSFLLPFLKGHARVPVMLSQLGFLFQW